MLMKKGSRGAALIEFALILPLLITLIFGTIEMGWLLFVRIQMTSAVQEGVRFITSDEAQTSSSTTTYVKSRLQSLGVQSSHTTVAVSPNDVSTAYRGDPIAVSISIPAIDVTLINFPIDVSSTTLSVSATAAKEY